MREAGAGPRPVRRLAGGMLPDGRVVDVALDGGRVVEVTPADAGAAGGPATASPT